MRVVVTLYVMTPVNENIKEMRIKIIKTAESL